MTDAYEGQLLKAGGCMSQRDRRHEWRLLDGPRLFKRGTLLAWRFYCVHCLQIVYREETE